MRSNGAESEHVLLHVCSELLVVVPVPNVDHDDSGRHWKLCQIERRKVDKVRVFPQEGAIVVTILSRLGQVQL